MLNNASEIMELQKLAGMENFKKLTIPQYLAREKLVELIYSTEYGNGSLIGNNFQKGFIEKIADHLVANGVTMQKWIPVTERLPEPFVRVLVLRDGQITIDYHEEDGWFAYDFKGKRATHWIPLPKPPKGD